MSEQTSTTVGAKNEKRIIPDVLYDFSRAVMGDHCRTRPVMVLQGHDRGIVSWLEAYQMRQGDWQLFRRFKTFNNLPLDVDHISFDQMVLDSKFTQERIAPRDKEGHAVPLGLMDIMYKMAEFEESARPNSRSNSHEFNILIEDLNGHTAKDLGDAYFRTFGNNECIAFDEERGLPVPSFEGRISGEGTFSDAQESAILKAWQNKVERYGKAGSYLDALAINPKPVSMLEEIYHQMNRRKAYTEILEYFEENIFQTFRDIKNKGFAHIVEIERAGQAPKRVHIGEALENIIAETIDNKVIEKTYASYFNEDDFDNIRKALMSMDIFRCIMHARWAIDVAMKDPNLTEESENFVKEQIKIIQEKYRLYDLDEVDENLIMQAILDKDSDQAIGIDSTIARIQNDLTTLRDKAASDASSLQSGRKPNAASPLKTKGGPA